MQVYRISFSIEVEATSHEAAAEIAHFQLSTMDDFDGTYEVQGVGEQDEPRRVKVVGGAAQ